MPSIVELKECAPKHLDEYTDPSNNYAFVTYDNWWGRSPDILTPMDVLAANLLSLQLSHGDVIPLFADIVSPATRLLHAMQTFLTETIGDSAYFEDLNSIDGVPFRLFRDACLATEASGNDRKVPQWTAVTVSKVLHRLRPHLVPVVDSLVSNFYGATRRPALYEALLRDVRGNKSWLADQADRRLTIDGRPLSLLRTVDIVVWHHEYTGCTLSG